MSDLPPEPKQRDETMEPNPASPLRAKALRMEHETDWEAASHIERINPSWGAAGGWVPGTGIPHHYDEQLAAMEKIEAEKRRVVAEAAAKESMRLAALHDAEQKAKEEAAAQKSAANSVVGPIEK